MKSKTFLFFIYIVAFFQLSFHLKTHNDWKLVKDKEGIKAYTREIEGSEIKQVRVKTNIKSSLSALTWIVKDVNTHKNWIYKCAKAKTIKTNSETDYFYYNESDAPWPISNRDIITHANIHQDKVTKTVTITSTGKPNFIKEIDGIVRIQRLNAEWEFIPQNNGTIDLNFYLLIDLGGNIPAWLVNIAIADGPFETVYNMRKEVQKEKYKNIKLSYIEEL